MLLRTGTVRGPAVAVSGCAPWAASFWFLVANRALRETDGVPSLQGYACAANWLATRPATMFASSPAASSCNSLAFPASPSRPVKRRTAYATKVSGSRRWTLPEIRWPVKRTLLLISSGAAETGRSFADSRTVADRDKSVPSTSVKAVSPILCRSGLLEAGVKRESVGRGPGGWPAAFPQGKRPGPQLPI
jgi:hypothetical protein